MILSPLNVKKLTGIDCDILRFMSAGGWDLTFGWLSDSIQAKNWPLVVELVELLLVCPVDIERLKGNNCPKVIKLLSKDMSATESELFYIEIIYFTYYIIPLPQRGKKVHFDKYCVDCISNFLVA